MRATTIELYRPQLNAEDAKACPGDDGEPDLVKCDNILKKLQSLQEDQTAMTNLTTFEGINAREYAYIDQKLEEESEWMMIRPAYFRNSQKLFVTRPSGLHEAPLEHMGFMLKSAVSSMPLQCGDNKIAIRYHNTDVRGESGVFIPDIHLTISAEGVGDPYLAIPREILFIECALTETEVHVRWKLRSLIEDHPDALAAVMIKIREIAHRFPAVESAAAKAHIGELPPKRKWLPRSNTDNALSANYNGITLLEVGSVSVHVWLRNANADKPIDFDDHNPDLHAEGTLHPVLSTAAVDHLLGEIMLAVKSLAVTYAKDTLNPSSQSSLGTQNWLESLRNWVPPKPLFNWHEVSAAIKEGLFGLARARYTTWHSKLPKQLSDDPSTNTAVRLSSHKLTTEQDPANCIADAKWITSSGFS